MCADRQTDRQTDLLITILCLRGVSSTSDLQGKEGSGGKGSPENNVSVIMLEYAVFGIKPTYNH